MVNFGYPYNDIVVCKDSTDYPQLIYMVSRNSTQLLNINTTKFQVEREAV